MILTNEVTVNHVLHWLHKRLKTFHAAVTGVCPKVEKTFNTNVNFIFVTYILILGSTLTLVRLSGTSETCVRTSKTPGEVVQSDK